jgi:hypothetical protein
MNRKPIAIAIPRPKPLSLKWMAVMFIAGFIAALIVLPYFF